MLWQKIKSFFKGKKVDAVQVQKKAQEIQEEVNQTQTFDPKVAKMTQVEDTAPKQQPPRESLHDILYKGGRLNIRQFDAMMLTEGLPIIDSEEVFENLKIPLKEQLKKHWIGPDELFSKFDLFNVSLEKIIKEKNFDQLDQIAENLSKEPLIHQMKDPEEFFLITIYGDAKKKKSPARVSIYEFFNKDDVLVKKFVNFMASNKIYSTSFDRDCFLHDLNNKVSSLYNNIEKMAKENDNMVQLGMTSGQIKQLYNKMQDIINIYTRTVISYGKVIYNYNLRIIHLSSCLATIINRLRLFMYTD